VQKSFNYLHAHSACPAIEAFAIDEENPALEQEVKLARPKVIQKRRVCPSHHTLGQKSGSL
jgi:hypothetical protein